MKTYERQEKTSKVTAGLKTLKVPRRKVKTYEREKKARNVTAGLETLSVRRRD